MSENRRRKRTNVVSWFKHLFKTSRKFGPPIETLRYTKRSESSLTVDMDRSVKWLPLSPVTVHHDATSKHVHFKPDVIDGLLTDSIRFVDDELTATYESVSTIPAGDHNQSGHDLDHGEDLNATEAVLSDEYLLQQIMDELSFEERSAVKRVCKLWYRCATKNPSFGNSFLASLQSAKVTSTCQFLRIYASSGLGEMSANDASGHESSVEQGQEAVESWDGVTSPIKVSKATRSNYHAEVINYYNHKLQYQWHTLNPMDFKKKFLEHFPGTDLRLKQVAGFGFMITLFEDGKEVLASCFPDMYSSPPSIRKAMASYPGEIVVSAPFRKNYGSFYDSDDEEETAILISV